MSDVSVAADAAPAPSVAPINQAPVDMPSPVESSFADMKAEAAAKAEGEKAAKPSLRDTIKANWDKSKTEIEAKAKPEADAKAPAKEAPKADAQPRAEGGKFAPKEAIQTPAQPVAQQASAQVAAEPAKPASEAPARFADDAKAIWKDTPEPIRRETERAIRELTQGHEKYKASAEAFEPLRQYHDMAKQSGTTLEAALASYTAAEQAIRRNPVEGLDGLCRNVLGASLKDVAAHVLGQPVDQQQSQAQAEIHQLKQRIAQLQQGFTSFKGELETREVTQVIQSFAADHPRFEELKPVIGQLMHGGLANDLSEAYQMAERLKPAPTAASPNPVASSAPAIDLVAQTQRGSKSIAGAPAPGSSPVTQQPSPSIREALNRAQRRAS